MAPELQGMAPHDPNENREWIPILLMTAYGNQDLLTGYIVQRMRQMGSA